MKTVPVGSRLHERILRNTTVGWDEWVDLRFTSWRLASASIRVPWRLLRPRAPTQVKVPGSLIFPRRSFYLEERRSGVLRQGWSREGTVPPGQGSLETLFCMTLLRGVRGQCDHKVPSPLRWCLFSCIWVCPEVALLVVKWKYLFQVEDVHLWSLTWGSLCFPRRIWQVWRRTSGLETKSWASYPLRHLIAFPLCSGRFQVGAERTLDEFCFACSSPFQGSISSSPLERPWSLGPRLLRSMSPTCGFRRSPSLFKELWKECFLLVAASGAWSDTFPKIRRRFLFCFVFLL